MLQKLKPHYNSWFMIPFLIWIGTGGALLLTFSKYELFHPFNAHYNAFFDVVMLWLTLLGHGYGIIILLVIILLILFRRYRNWWYVTTATLCIAAPALFSQWIKSLVRAPRPFTYFAKNAGWIHFDPAWSDRLFHDSFPSGHTTGAFSLFCFLSLILPVKWAPAGLLFFLMALMVGYSRMYLAAHFFADVYMGSIIGTVFALLLFAIMKRWHPSKHTLSNHEA